jgi:sodium/proline symporter
MTRATAVLIGVCLLAAAMIAGAVWGVRRTYNASDYLIASRRLNVWLTALSYTANATPAWLLFALVGAAFAWGISAIWMALALLAGSVLNWFYVAPRLRRLAVGQGSVSVVQIVGANVGERLQALLVRSGAVILGIALVLLMAAQLHSLAEVGARDLGLSATATIIFCAIAYSLYVAVGGYWAASLADAFALLALLAIALLLLIPATIAAGGLEQLQVGFQSLGSSALDPFGGRTSIVALAFTAGVLGLGLSLPGQPQALSRFIATKDEETLSAARWRALAFSALLFAVLLACGWCAQVLYAGIANPDFALVALATRMLPPGMGTLLAMAVLATVMVSIGGQLLVVAGLVAADLKRPHAAVSLPVAHVATVAAAIVAACVAAYAPSGLLERSMFAFTMLGAAFGPLVLVRVAGKRIRPGAALGAMWAGAVLSWLFHLLPDSPGDFLERVLPFVAALGIALSGGERRSNPDRADRGQETVHDRVPI